MAQVTVITATGKKIFAARVQHSTPSGAGNSPPTLGSESPGRGISIGTGATAAGADASSTDTSLVQEVETRVVGVETITGGSLNVFQSVGSVAATATRVVDELAMSDAYTQTVTAAAQANAAATSINIGATNPFTLAGTLYAFNRTSGTAAQSISASSYSNPNLTVSALTGQINSGDWITSSNLAVRTTLRGATITLNTGDSVQSTFQVTFS